MARKAGSADLPLHSGHVPKWLAERMTRLGTVISEAIVHHYGRDELLRRLTHPFWFQSFGAVMGMDWAGLFWTEDRSRSRRVGSGFDWLDIRAGELARQYDSGNERGRAAVRFNSMAAMSSR